MSSRREKWILGCGCGGTILFAAFIFMGIPYLNKISNKQRFDKVRDLGPPDMTGKPIYAPNFDTSMGLVEAGTAFLSLNPDSDSVFLLSAHHLLGEAGGLAKEVGWSDVATVVKGVECLPLVVDFEKINLTEPVPIIGASAMDQVSGADDLLVFKAPDSFREMAIPIRTDPIQINEPVWLYASVYGSDALFHLAIVTVSDGQWLEYLFENEIQLMATSGAPVLDKEGRLVAINLGGYDSMGLTGLGNPSVAIRIHLSKLR